MHVALRSAAIGFFRDAVAFRCSTALELLALGRALPHTAIPGLVPAVVNLSNALPDEEREVEGAHWHMLLVAFLPLLPENVANQIIVSAHSCAEASSATLGQSLHLVDRLVPKGGSCSVRKYAASRASPQVRCFLPPQQSL
jgi:hypothetical protein